MKVITAVKRTGIVLCIINLLACQDHLVEPQRPRFRIRQTLYESRFTYGSKVFESYSTVVYIYDNMRRLSSYVTYPESVADPASTNKQVTQLQYDQQGRLILSETLRGGNYGTSVRVTYEYDASGRLYLVKQYRQNDPGDNFSLSKTDSLAYTANVLTNWTFFVHTSPLIVNVSTFTFTDGNATSVNGVNLTYDDKPNPFYGYVFPELNVVEQLSRNNVVRENQTLAYDSNGMLIKKGSYTYLYEPY